MIMSPANLQTQLGEAISVIADSDFWKRWDTLIPVRTQWNGKKETLGVLNTNATLLAGSC